MVIAQFWAFVNDVYTVEQGKRLLPVVVWAAASGPGSGPYTPAASFRQQGLCRSC